jgi:hypothetical protein
MSSQPNRALKETQDLYSKQEIEVVRGMKKLILYPLGLSLLFLSSFASAAMVTENWSANVNLISANVDGFSLGEQITWSVTYDDASLAWHEYAISDGSLAATHTRSPFDGTSGFHYASDATFDFGDTFGRLLDDDDIGRLYTRIYGYIEESTNSTGNQLKQSYQDLVGYIFNLNTGGSGGFSLFSPTAGYKQVGFESAAIVAPVPLPAAAWLFGSALLGLLGVNLRKREA